MNLPANSDSNTSELDDEVPTRFPSSWRWKRWLVVMGLPVAVVLAILGWFWFATANELQSRLNAMKAKGLPTSASEVNDFYRVPEGGNDRTQEWMVAIQAVEAANLHMVGKDLPIVDDYSKEIPPPGQPWEDFEASRTFLRSHDKELQLIRLAASIPGQVRFPHDFSDGLNTLLPLTYDSRQVARLLQLDAHVSAHEGNFARSLQDINDLFALSNAQSGEPCLMSKLVHFGIQTTTASTIEKLMPHCGWNDSELASLQVTIGSAQIEIEMQRAMASEMAVILTEFDKMPMGPFRNPNKLGLLTHMNEWQSSLSQPWPEPLNLQAESSTRLFARYGKSSYHRSVYTGLLLLAPSIEQMGQATCRSVARQRFANLGIAAYRHQLKHGQLPGSLAELDTTLISGSSTSKDFAIDPFDGQPLRFRKDATGLLIYSVSQNLIDDGGDVVSSDTNPRPGDIGFQIAIPMPAAE